MTIDAIDAAFLGRWDRDTQPAPAPDAVEPAHGPPAVVEPPAAPTATVEPLRDEPAPPLLATGSVLDRLLATAWPQWNRLAETVEGARGRGRRVIAVAGGEAAEGRSTLVAGLAHVLRGRGRDVVEVGPEGIGNSSAPTHDKRIVLVDAGVWFPPGPIRRQRLTVASLGCEAAILVRRADRQPVPAREAALEALGIEVLGEVVSFAPVCEPVGAS